MNTITIATHRDIVPARPRPAKTTALAPRATAAPAPIPDIDGVRARAYEIYCARNGGPGDETSDWLRAEQELHAVRETGEAHPHAAPRASRGEMLLADDD